MIGDDALMGGMAVCVACQLGGPEAGEQRGKALQVMTSS
jgi:hypothetical protein